MANNIDTNPANVAIQQDPGLAVPSNTIQVVEVYDAAPVVVGGIGNSNALPNIIPDTPVYLRVQEDSANVVVKTAVMNFTGNAVTVTGSGSLATVQIDAIGPASFGNWGFSANTLYNFNGGIIDNSNNIASATAFVRLPANGSGTDPYQLLNYYGNITLTPGLNTGNTYNWTFDRTGNLTMPNNTAVIKYANGTPYGGSGSGNSTPGGSNTQIQFNDGGTFAGNASLTYNKVTRTLTAQTVNLANLYFTGTGAVNIESGNDMNISAAGYVTVQDWTFNAAGNLILPGNTQSINYANGSPYGAASYGNSNVVTLLSAFGSNTVSTTGNITGGNVITNTIVGTGLTLRSTGDLTLSTTGNINANNEYINNIPTPVQDGDAANKLYVDNFVSGLNIHDAVKAATPTTLATITGGTITYNNGANGVGATLSTTGAFNLIDTVNVQTSGTRILVLNEANAVTNGIYVWSNATAITRATDYNSTLEVEAGDFMFVTNGNVYANTGWVQTSTISNIGLAGNNITFTQFSGAATYNAGTGLTLTGTTFSVNASQTQITSVGTLDSLSVSGNVTGGNITTAGVLKISGSSSYIDVAGTGFIQNAGAGEMQISTVAGKPLVINTNAGAYAWNFGTAGNLTLPNGGTVSGTGNITAGYFFGNGSQLTGVAGTYGNANVAANLAAFGSNPLSTTGNITGGNLLTGGLISATGNITGGNILGGANVNATTHTGTTVSVTGNITGGNLAITGNTATVTSANYSIGYLNIPQVSLASNVTTALTDSGKHYYSTSASNLALTIANNTSVTWPVGTAISIVNRGTANITIAGDTGVSLYLAGNSTAGNRTVTTYGMATVMNVAANVWMINGTVV